MGKRLIIVGASVIIAWPISAQITNVTQCLNIPLSPSILETIDSFDLATACVCFADPSTNVVALVGIPLRTAEIVLLPQQDDSSPDTLFLGVVRALVTGEIRDLFSHFDANYFADLTGYADLQSIPSSTDSSFASTMQDSAVSNIVITAFSTSVSNQFVRIDASLQENFSQRSVVEPLQLTLEQNAGIWKIVSYDDDKWDD